MSQTSQTNSREFFQRLFLTTDDLFRQVTVASFDDDIKSYILVYAEAVCKKLKSMGVPVEPLEKVLKGVTLYPNNRSLFLSMGTLIVMMAWNHGRNAPEDTVSFFSSARLLDTEGPLLATEEAIKEEMKEEKYFFSLSTNPKYEQLCRETTAYKFISEVLGRSDIAQHYPPARAYVYLNQAERPLQDAAGKMIQEVQRQPSGKVLAISELPAKLSMKEVIKMIKALRRSFRKVKEVVYGAEVTVDTVLFRSVTYQSATGQRVKGQYLTLDCCKTQAQYLVLVDNIPVLVVGPSLPSELVKTEIKIAV